MVFKSRWKRERERERKEKKRKERVWRCCWLLRGFSFITMMSVRFVKRNESSDCLPLQLNSPLLCVSSTLRFILYLFPFSIHAHVPGFSSVTFFFSTCIQILTYCFTVTQLNVLLQFIILFKINIMNFHIMMIVIRREIQMNFIFNLI